MSTWASNTFSNNELKEVDGVSFRLLEANELVDDLGCTSNNCTNSSNSWTYSSSYNYWTMSTYSNDNNSVWVVKSDGTLGELSVSSTAHIRPVIYVLKTAISNN